MEHYLMNEATARIIDFVKSIGIPVEFGPLPEDTVLPGLLIKNGGLIIDSEKLLYPGDILHEAGHIAVTTPENRAGMDGILESTTDQSISEELMAIPWSYAACLHLEIDPQTVFHEHGYNGGGNWIIENFMKGSYFGLPMLQWVGLSYEKENPDNPGIPPFPHMIKWMR